MIAFRPTSGFEQSRTRSCPIVVMSSKGSMAAPAMETGGLAGAPEVGSVGERPSEGGRRANARSLSDALPSRALLLGQAELGERHAQKDERAAGGQSPGEALGAGRDGEDCREGR